MIRISVIIPTYKDWHALEDCLNAIYNQSLCNANYEVLIVNNNPEDEVPLYIQNFREARVLHEPKPGSYAARNKGINEAKGEILAFTDSDCIPDRDWLFNALQKFDNGVKRIGGNVIITVKNNNNSFVGSYEKIFSFDQSTNVANGTSVTANMFTLKRNFNEVGLFNDSLLSGGDFEWGEQANNNGINIVYAEDVIVYHGARENLGELLRKCQRVAGGAILKEKESNKYWGLSYKFKIFIKAIIPPTKGLIKIIHDKNTSLSDKSKAYCISYLLKIMSAYYRLRLVLGCDTPTR